MSAKDVVLDTMMQTVPRVTAEFLLDCLKGEWAEEKVNEEECDHANWRYIYDEPDAWSKCDGCGKRNVTVGS